MAEPVTKTIDGHDYKIVLFGARTGWRLQMKLGRMLAPAVKEALGAIPDGKLQSLLNANLDMGKVGGAAGALIEAITENDPNGALVEELLSSTERDGKMLTPGQIDISYQGNYIEEMKAVVAVVQANGFFGIGSTGLGAVLQNVATAQNSPESSPKK